MFQTQFALTPTPQHFKTVSTAGILAPMVQPSRSRESSSFRSGMAFEETSPGLIMHHVDATKAASRQNIFENSGGGGGIALAMISFAALPCCLGYSAP